MEIKNKLAVTRGEGRGGKQGEGCQGTCIKDPWTKTTWKRFNAGGGGG